jgi:Mg/Co/Ni transporter MgtE
MAQQIVDWRDLHLTSPRGHAIQLATPGAGVRKLRPAELASLAAHLPAQRAAEVLRMVAPDTAAGAMSMSHPQLGVRLLHAFPENVAAAVVERMPTDDATTLLRALPPAERDRLLAEVPTERAATLRRLLSHRVDTAGGLMNPTSAPPAWVSLSRRSATASPASR